MSAQMHAWRAQMHASRAHVHASRAHAVTDTCVEERERRGPLLALWLARPLLPIPQAAANGAKPRVGRTRYRSSLWACAAHIKRSVGCGSSNWRKQKGSRLKVDIVIVDSRARCAKEPAGRRAAMLRMQVFRKVRTSVSRDFFRGKWSEMELSLRAAGRRCRRCGVQGLSTSCTRRVSFALASSATSARVEPQPTWPTG